jgi:hypothetical protein
MVAVWMGRSVGETWIECEERTRTSDARIKSRRVVISTRIKNNYMHRG